ncbi:DoxX family protein [Virgibacillus sp. NKC19-16]|uniref:DoxX family protein n=1 Tax=Virgibacillus salidurans TaxID=2831673 RepID=UPI001F1D90B4|nr:DoxX family protein [Virgibacillus sp. NKC19-16]UJL46329.1 DoxX family protein [Virgibacillus sp. NKC19-16]
MIKQIGLYVFAILFMGAGFAHFFLDHFFISSMPEWVPFRPTTVYLSGIVEIVLALCLISPKTRYKTGRWVAIFLVLVFPVNIYMVLTPENYNLPAIALWFRLPLQLVLIWWVLVVTRKNYLDSDRKGINRHI